MRNITALSSLLSSLCDNAPWNYAVFWKLKHGRNMILTWEDGCSYNVKANMKVEHTLYDEPAHVVPTTTPIPCIHDDDQDGTLANFPIKVALEYMSNKVYLMGDGIVGKAALEKRHYWIFSGDVNYKSRFQHYEDCHLQFAAGIKTILLVPVGNYGVVQLGSLHLVPEDFKVVVHISGLFSNLYHHSQTFSSLCSFVDCSSTFFPQFMPSVKRSTLTAGLFVPDDSKHFSSPKSDLFPVMDGCDFLWSPNLMNNQMLDFDISRYADETDWNMMYSNQLPGPSEEPILLNSSSNMFGGDMSKSITENERESNMQPMTNCRSNVKQFDYSLENINGWHNISDAGTILFQEVERDYSGGKTHYGILAQEDSAFPTYLESHNAFGLTTMREPDACSFNMTIPKVSMTVSSVPSFPTEGSEINGFSFDENHSAYLKECDGDNLLEAVVSSFRRQSYNTPDSTSERLLSYSPEKLTESFLTQSATEFSISEFGNLLSANKKGSVSDAEGITSSLATSLETVSRLANGDENWAANEHHRKKPDKKIKREKHDKHKPRPRDRQLIQDRIKELRELIPNGSNCSIDALLDKTVKHMLFLHGISAQVDKLRQYEGRKVKGEVCDSFKPGNNPNGASWAYEVGSKPANFPLIIENLDQPGQILVEMMCKDYGLFLEIAHVIRHLDLMILKGVLESRSDKLWAHFVIEVSKDFQRTQILWPLMQLVQQNYKCG